MKEYGRNSPTGFKMAFCMQQNRPAFVIGAAILCIIFYLHYISVLQKQQEISVQRTLSRTLEILRDMDNKASAYYSQNGGVPLPTKDPEEFSVADRGFWQGLGATKGHVFDPPLCAALLEFFKQEKVTTLLELGAGTGAYAKDIKAAGIHITCYDGNPETQDLSEGRCAIVDLSKPIDFSKHDWTLSLEVGEHIPSKFEDIFISNLVSGNRNGMILSWAIEGQGGTSHVNNHNNSYIREKIASKGYNSDFAAEESLRAAASMGWFKNTIMVFRKQL